MNMLELLTRMNHEETQDALSLNLRHAQETLAVIADAVEKKEWERARLCLILLNLKTGILGSQLATLSKQNH